MSIRRIVLSIAQLLVSIGILGWLMHQVGIAPFITAVKSLSPASVIAALAIGGLATLIQAHRWRLTSRGFNIELGQGEAVAKCWQAAFLNTVLPGGLAGDTLRVIEQRTEPAGTWRGSIGSVLGERLAGTTVMFVAAAIALLPQLPWLAAAIGAVALMVAIVVWPSLRKLSARARWGVLGLAMAGWLVFAALFLIAAASDTSGPVGGILARTTPFEVFALTAVTLAGMSIPLSWGGWGPREGAAALVFPLFGSSAAAGVAVAFSYGILALISVLPGAAILLARLVLRVRRNSSPGREVEFRADVTPKGHASDRSRKSF